MQRRIGMLQALSAMAMVGGAVTASGFLTDYPPFAAQAIRYAIASAVLASCARFVGSVEIRRPVGRQWWWLVASATAGLSGYNLAVVRALEHAEPAIVATVVACVPLVLALGAPLVARRAVPLALLGAALVVVLGAVIIQGGGRSDAAGVALSLVALAGEAGFTLLAMPVLARLGAFSVATHTCWIAAIQFMVLAAIIDRGNAIRLPSVEVTLAVVYLIAASAAAFVLWFLAVSSIGGELAGLAAGIIPVAAAATGLVVGSTTIDLRVGVGIVIVVIGVGGGSEAARRAARRRDATLVIPPRPALDRLR